MHFYNKPIHTSLINLISIMDLSSRVVVVRSTLTPEEEEYPSFISDDISILFGDIATPTGFSLNKGDPRECYVVFPESGYIPEIPKLIEDPQWVSRHMHLTLERPRKGILPIVAKLLRVNPLKRGKTLNISLLNLN